MKAKGGMGTMGFASLENKMIPKRSKGSQWSGKKFIPLIKFGRHKM